jgi:fructose-1-phosphate kinase PfkB-like protein
MGNQLDSQYNIDKFVNEVHPTTIIDIADKDIRRKLENLLNIFEGNKDYFVEYKKSERINFNLKKDNENNEENKEDGNETDESRKSQKFLNLITYMIGLNYNSDTSDIYLKLLDIMHYLSIIF